MKANEMTWEAMNIEKGLKAEGRNDDFIAGARWAWEANQKALRLYFSMKGLKD